MSQNWNVITGDCVERMAEMPAESADAVVCDPPYLISFMGSAFDSQATTGQEMQAWHEAWAREALRVLKPGGHLLAFGGTRTSHRLVCAVEDAGFEIRDSITWLYGCLTPDVEVLTADGWKRGIDIEVGERVAQWDQDTEAITLAAVERTYRAPYDGPMRVLRNHDTDQLLTPNHRVVHEAQRRQMTAGVRRSWWQNEWTVAEATDVPRSGAVRLPLAGYADGHGIVGGEDYAELLGWVWTEGSFDRNGTGVRIYQSPSANPEKVERIEALMRRVAPGHKRYDRTRTYESLRVGVGTVQVSEATWFFSGDLARRVRGDLPGKLPSLNVLWRMTLVERRTFLDAALLGDGSRCKRTGSWQFDAKRRADLDVFQIALALTGQRGRVTMRKDREAGAVSVTPRATTELQTPKLRRSDEHYRGDVWCIGVPTGAFLARRDGQVFVTGNSGFPKSLDVSKAIDKAAGAEREVVGEGAAFGRGSMRNRSRVEMGYRPTEVNPDGGAASVTAPATADAERWQGWGTALKPASEPVVVARKPLRSQGILAAIGSELGIIEAWLAQGAESATPTGGVVGSPDQTDTLPSGSMATTFLNTVTSWRKCWEELWTAESMSTTSTESRTTTDLRTLLSSLSESTRESTIPVLMQSDGLMSLVEAVDNLFAAAVLSLRATHALSVAESVTAPTPTNSPDEAGRSPSPASEPIVVARKPLGGTVAGNVLKHGTGALNIEGCRIGSGAGGNRDGEDSADRRYTDAGSTNFAPTPGPRGGDAAGRWPANVVLSHVSREWYVLRPDADGVEAIAAYYGLEQALRELRQGNQGDAVAAGEEALLLQGVRWRSAPWNAEGRVGDGYGECATSRRVVSLEVCAELIPSAWRAAFEWSHAEGCELVGERTVVTGVAVNRHKDPAAPSGNQIYAERRNGSRADVSYGEGGRETVEAWECAEGCPVRALDEQTGESRPTGSEMVSYGDKGGASRYFATFRYQAKASRAERNAGLDNYAHDGKICVCLDPKAPAVSPPRATSAHTEEADSDSCTAGSGSSTTDPSLTDSKSTISTRSRPITESRTSNSLPPPSTSESTLRTSGEPPMAGSAAAPSAASGSPPTLSTTTSAAKAGSSTDGADLATSHGSSPTSSGAVCADCGGVVAGAWKNTHPLEATVKPIDLMRWLVRLVTPPGGLILDPFLGSGTTGAAAVLEGFEFIGIERDPEYARIAEARIAWWSEHPPGTDTKQALKRPTGKSKRLSFQQGRLI